MTVRATANKHEGGGPRRFLKLWQGLILLSLIPANTQLGRTCEMKDLSASSCCGHATFSSWSSCHVLTSALFIAIVNLAAPTQRSCT
mmetsp:Transcript_3718/g.13335  ORF Transcript_3718/g.13335 Transcript_3718/m.13335 type:complete len:87 (-) Transcript_3718:2038-2298(-)